MGSSNLKDYYDLRAAVYEAVYSKPERKEDLERLKTELRSAFAGRDVLEVACGTGYWTQVIAGSAVSILASDQSEQTLEIARKKEMPTGRVEFVRDDAYSLAGAKGDFDGGFAGFWWSHVPKSRMNEFMETFHSKLLRGSRVVMVDNQYVAGSNHPITRTDSEGNTYQTRALPDGSQHEVLKNFPTDEELRASVAAYAVELEIRRLRYFWILSYRLERPN